MSIFDFGFGLAAGVGVSIAALGIIIWHIGRDWQKERIV